MGAKTLQGVSAKESKLRIFHSVHLVSNSDCWNYGTALTWKLHWRLGLQSAGKAEGTTPKASKPGINLISAKSGKNVKEGSCKLTLLARTLQRVSAKNPFGCEATIELSLFR